MLPPPPMSFSIIQYRASSITSHLSMDMVSVPVTGLFLPSWPYSEYLACDSSELGFHRPPWPPAFSLIEVQISSFD